MLSTTEYNAKIMCRFTELRLDGLDDKIRENNAVISGSFISQVVHDEYYEVSDIDIYVHSTRTNNYPFPKTDFDKWIISHLGGVYFPSGSSHGTSSYKYVCPLVVINIILVKEDDIKGYIYSTTDIDICKSNYDGHRVTYHPGLLTKQARSINLHLIKPHRDINIRNNEEGTLYKPISLCQRTSIGYLNHLISKREMRIEKYKRRGFKFPTKSECKDYDRVLQESKRVINEIYLEIFCLIFKVYLNQTLKTWNQEYIYPVDESHGYSNLTHLSIWFQFGLNQRFKICTGDLPFCKKWVSTFGIKEIFEKIAMENEEFPKTWNDYFSVHERRRIKKRNVISSVDLSESNATDVIKRYKANIEQYDNDFPKL